MPKTFRALYLGSMMIVVENNQEKVRTALAESYYSRCCHHARISKLSFSLLQAFQSASFRSYSLDNYLPRTRFLTVGFILRITGSVAFQETDR